MSVSLLIYFSYTRDFFAYKDMKPATQRGRKKGVRPVMLVGVLHPPQLFSRYPVRKIHPTTTRQMTKNPRVIARLTPTPTSDVP